MDDTATQGPTAWTATLFRNLPSRALTQTRSGAIVTRYSNQGSYGTNS